jgi:hypothetical protein
MFISSKEYLTAAASVLATEARHASWVAAAVNGNAGWSGALDVSGNTMRTTTFTDTHLLTGTPWLE